LSAGEYEFRAQGVIAGVAGAESPSVRFRVAATNLPPRVSITRPAPDTVVPLKGTYAPVEVSVKASDPDDRVARLRLYGAASTGGPLSLLTELTVPPGTPNADFTFQPVQRKQGSHALYVTAEDSRGLVSDSVPVRVHVGVQPTACPPVELGNAHVLTQAGTLFRILDSSANRASLAAPMPGEVARWKAFQDGTNAVALDEQSDLWVVQGLETHYGTAHRLNKPVSIKAWRDFTVTSRQVVGVGDDGQLYSWTPGNRVVALEPPPAGVTGWRRVDGRLRAYAQS
jgi:hypothetical protein